MGVGFEKRNLPQPNAARPVAQPADRMEGVVRMRTRRKSAIGLALLVGLVALIPLTQATAGGIVTLAAAHLIGGRPAPVRTTAWYPKPQATFSDAIALVRRALWCVDHFPISGIQPDVVKIPRSLLERLTDALCYAA